MRSGHTEAAVDLCKLAGLPLVGVISELVNDDGTVMRGPQVAAFAEKHTLTQVSVADLIAYRQRQETLVERVGCSRHRDPRRQGQGLHLHRCPGTRCTIWPSSSATSATARTCRCASIPRMSCSDVFGNGSTARRHHDVDGREAARRHRLPARGFRRRRRTVARKRPTPADRESHEEARRREDEWREIGLGAQILKDLGITSITSSPRANATMSASRVLASRSSPPRSSDGYPPPACRLTTAARGVSLPSTQAGWAGSCGISRSAGRSASSCAPGPSSSSAWSSISASRSPTSCRPAPAPASATASATSFGVDGTPEGFAFYGGIARLRARLGSSSTGSANTSSTSSRPATSPSWSI